MLEIRLLGQFDLRQDATPIEISSRPARTLLAYLVLTRGTHHPREKLAGLMWPESSESNARKNLRQALWQLRSAVGETNLLADSTSLCFDTGSEYWLDIGVLEDSGDDDLEKAVSVYEGELLPGFYEDWVLLERDRLEAAFDRKMDRFLRTLLHGGKWQEVVNWAEQWIAKGRVPESGFRALMIAHAALGELSAVEATYQRCAGALMLEVGVEPSEETERLYRGLLAGDEVAEWVGSGKSEEPASGSDRLLSLPAQPNRFIGRREEVEEIARILSQTRLLTLSGPGGIGKTRLAIKTAAEMADQFDHGCCFVSLAPIQRADHIVQKIAEAIGFPIATQEEPRRQLLRYLKSKQLLLVLDNFEHLLEAADIVSDILQAAPKVTILATSRERLNLLGETNYVVRGMSFPQPVESENSADYDAVSLFIQRAQKVRPEYELSPEEITHAARICQMVGGMPLAIELAAAWLHVLDVGEILTELEGGFDILATEARDTPERHRSIHAVFDHSWSLLSPDQQQTFMVLAVFRGGFTREAAQQVAGASLQLLAELTNKSFLRHDPSAGRFEIHELLRQYAMQQLRDTREAWEAAQSEHAIYYADFMQQRGQLLRGKRQEAVLAEIEADIENLRTAWRYFLERQNSAQLWRFITGIWHSYWIRWWNHAGMELFAQAAEAMQGRQDDESVTFRALATAYQGYFMAWLDLAEEGYRLSQESVEILRRRDRPDALVFAYDSLMVNAYFLGRITEERDGMNEMIEIATRLDDRWLLAFALFGAGMVAVIDGDHSEAIRIAELSLKLYQEVGDRSGSTTPLIVLGHVSLARGEYEAAREYYLRCLEVSEQVGFHYSTQTSTKYLAKVAVSIGQAAQAEAYLRQSLQITNEIGFVRDIINLLYEFARVRVAQDRPVQAVELLALVVEHPASDQTRWLEGRIRDSAFELLSELEDALANETYVAALNRGRRAELDDVVAALTEGNDT